MPITFLQQRKKQEILVIVFILIVFFILIVWGKSLLKGKPFTFLPPEFIPEEKIKINFEILKDPFLKELQPFEKIFPFEGEEGRENPFLPLATPTLPFFIEEEIE
jgi:hypothetical protein